MSRDSTERAATKATAVDIDRVANHCPRRDFSPIIISRVRRAHIWQIKGVINLLGSKCRVHWIDNHKLVARRLHNHLFGCKQVTLGLDSNEVFAKGSLVLTTLLKGVQEYGFISIKSLNILFIGHKRDLTDRANTLRVKAVVHSMRNLSDNALTHTIE